jgi:hypothetical protein
MRHRFFAMLHERPSGLFLYISFTISIADSPQVSFDAVVPIPPGLSQDLDDVRPFFIRLPDPMRLMSNKHAKATIIRSVKSSK